MQTPQQPLPTPPAVEAVQPPAEAAEEPKRQPEPEPFPCYLRDDERRAFTELYNRIADLSENSQVAPDPLLTPLLTQAGDALFRLLEAEAYARGEAARLETECSRLLDVVHKRTNADESRRPPGARFAAPPAVEPDDDAPKQPAGMVEDPEQPGKFYRASRVNVELLERARQGETQSALEELQDSVRTVEKMVLELRSERTADEEHRRTLSAAGLTININTANPYRRPRR